VKALARRLIILHCSATKPDQDIGARTIRKWHTTPPRNWSDIGYHYVIRLDGQLEYGRPLSKAGAHTKGFNDSIGVCYVGGLDGDGVPADTMTMEQELTWLRLVDSLRTSFGELAIDGHNSFARKACPCFDVKEKYGWLDQETPDFD